MKKVVISHRLTTIGNDYILVDGQNIPFKYDRDHRCYVGEYETSNDSVLLNLDSFHPLLMDGWWWKSMLFFVISVFGLFEPRMKKRTVLLYEGRVELKEEGTTYITLRSGTFANPSSILAIETDGVYVEKENCSYADPIIKKRRTALVWSKIGLVVLIIAIAIIAVILSN